MPTRTPALPTRLVLATPALSPSLPAFPACSCIHHNISWYEGVLFDDLQQRLDKIVVSAIDEIGTAREGGERRGKRRGLASSGAVLRVGIVGVIVCR